MTFFFIRLIMCGHLKVAEVVFEKEQATLFRHEPKSNEVVQSDNFVLATLVQGLVRFCQIRWSRRREAPQPLPQLAAAPGCTGRMGIDWRRMN
jgi:hypothetical protein